jgi:hypothetical protein
MSSIHKNLILDHIYFSVSDMEFLELKSILSKLECVVHDIVKSDGESWEGLYLFTRGFNYLEFVREYRADAMGICQKPYGTLYQDSAHILNDFPELSWKTFSRTADGKPWFTSYSLEDIQDPKTLFNTWVMKYYQHDSGNLLKLKKFEIERVCRIEVSANLELFETIKKNSSWMNAQIEFNKKKASYKFQTYFSDDYELVIFLDEMTKGLRFENATFQLKDSIPAAESMLKVFKSEFIDKTFTVSRIDK